MTKKRDINVETGKQGFQPREKNEVAFPTGGIGAPEVALPRMLDDGHRFAELMVEDTGYDSSSFEVYLDDDEMTVEMRDFRAHSNGLPASDPDFNEMVADADGPIIEEFLENNISAEDLATLIDTRREHPFVVWTVCTESGLTGYDPGDDQVYVFDVDDDGKRELVVMTED